MNFYGTTVGPQHTLVGRIAPMREAFLLAIYRAADKAPITVRYGQNFPGWAHNVVNELTKTIFRGLVRMAPRENESPETVACKAGQLVGFAIRAGIFYWKEAPAQIERAGLNKLTSEQKETVEKMAGWELLLPEASELAGRRISVYNSSLDGLDYILKGSGLTESTASRWAGDYHELSKFGGSCDVTLSKSVCRYLGNRSRSGWRGVGGHETRGTDTASSTVRSGVSIAPPFEVVTGPAITVQTPLDS
jgi:hypothetical protein